MRKFSLNNNWQFTKGELRNPLMMMNLLGGWQACHLPHDCQILKERGPSAATAENEGWTQGAAVFHKKGICHGAGDCRKAVLAGIRGYRRGVRDLGHRPIPGQAYEALHRCYRGGNAAGPSRRKRDPTPCGQSDEAQFPLVCGHRAVGWNDCLCGIDGGEHHTLVSGHARAVHGGSRCRRRGCHRHRRRVQILLDNGYHAVRETHNPFGPAFYEACDELGMLVIEEAFDEWVVGRMDFGQHITFEDRWERELEDTIRRDYSHTSIIMWSTGNQALNMAYDTFAEGRDLWGPGTEGDFAPLNVAGYN